jgi:hypothetical protein
MSIKAEAMSMAFLLVFFSAKYRDIIGKNEKLLSPSSQGRSTIGIGSASVLLLVIIVLALAIGVTVYIGGLGNTASTTSITSTSSSSSPSSSQTGQLVSVFGIVGTTGAGTHPVSLNFTSEKTSTTYVAQVSSSLSSGHFSVQLPNQDTYKVTVDWAGNFTWQ